MSPVDTAVWWIEYAIRNRGAQHLKYRGAEISLIEYFLIDVILAHILFVLFLLFLIKKLIYITIKFFKGKSEETIKKNK